MSKYDELADFIENRMRMEHVYQPVMLMTLLQNGGITKEPRTITTIIVRVSFSMKRTMNPSPRRRGRLLIGGESTLGRTPEAVSMVVMADI